MRAVFTYIRPLLECNSVVWNACHKYLVDSLENVQRNFTKRILASSSYSYYEKFIMLKLETLEVRRLRFDLIYYFKILHNLTPFDCNLVFNNKQRPTFRIFGLDDDRRFDASGFT
jgi:hypothetical protein